MIGAEIAECLGMALSTVSAVLVRIGLESSRGWSRPSRPTATNVSAARVLGALTNPAPETSSATISLEVRPPRSAGSNEFVGSMTI